MACTGGTGANSLTIRNTSSGTGNYADLILANDASAGAFRITQTASNYTASGPYQQDASIVNGFRSGGLSLSAGHASGDVRIYAGGLTSPSAARAAAGPRHSAIATARLSVCSGEGATRSSIV